MDPFDEEEQQRKALESRINEFKKSDREDDAPPVWRGFAAVGTLGFVIGVSLMLGVGIGVYLDNRWHTKPWLSIVGLLLGLAAAAKGAYELLRTSIMRGKD